MNLQNKHCVLIIILNYLSCITDINAFPSGLEYKIRVHRNYEICTKITNPIVSFL